MFVGTASCAQAIDGFEHSCGMSLRGYKAKGHFTPKPAGLHLDATKSAFGATVAIDPAFVPPQARPKKQKAPSRAPSNQSRDPTRRPQSAARTKAAPVDFVYDVDTRKELRQALDKERRELLQQAQERERTLRDANLWLHDRRNDQGSAKAKSQPTKTTTRPKPTSKECWISSSCEDLLRAVSVAVEIKDDADDEITWTSSGTTKSKTKRKQGRPLTAKGPRNSVAENVHRSAPQTQAYHRGS